MSATERVEVVDVDEPVAEQVGPKPVTAPTVAQPVEPAVVETRDTEPAERVVVKKERRFSSAALLGLLLGVVSVLAWVLTNGSLVRWSVDVVPTFEWIGLVTAVFGFFFAMIGLGQRKREGRGYAVLGIVLSVVGLVVAQGFWSRLVEIISSGFVVR